MKRSNESSVIVGIVPFYKFPPQIEPLIFIPEDTDPFEVI